MLSPFHNILFFTQLARFKMRLKLSVQFNLFAYLPSASINTYICMHIIKHIIVHITLCMSDWYKPVTWSSSVFVFWVI